MKPNEVAVYAALAHITEAVVDLTASTDADGYPKPGLDWESVSKARDSLTDAAAALDRELERYDAWNR